MLRSWEVTGESEACLDWLYGSGKVMKSLLQKHVNVVEQLVKERTEMAQAEARL